MTDYMGIAIKPETQRLVFIDKNGCISAEARHGDELRFAYPVPYSMVYPKYEDSVLVGRLPLSSTLPDLKIDSFTTGRPEEFRSALGFANAETAPCRPTIALWSALKNRAFSAFELLYGGQDLNVTFGVNKWLGCTGKAGIDPDTKISLCQPGMGMKFKRNCHTTGWALLNEE